MAPRHCRPWRALARVPSWRGQTQRCDDAAPCPPHHPTPSASDRRDATAAEPSGVRVVRARARRVTRRRRGPLRAPHASALPHLAPLVPSPPPRRVRAPTAPQLPCTRPTRPQRTRRSTPLAMAGRARHRRPRVTPVPLDPLTTSAAPLSSPQPLWHPQPDPAPSLPSPHHRAVERRAPPPL